MLKKFVIVFCLFALVFSFADARKRKAKSGDIDDNVYTDSEYDFTVKIPEGWNSSTKKADSPVRLVLTKKQYDIPIAYTQDPNYTKIPKVTLYVDTTSLNLHWFVDSILDEDNVYN